MYPVIYIKEHTGISYYKIASRHSSEDDLPIDFFPIFIFKITGRDGGRDWNRSLLVVVPHSTRRGWTSPGGTWVVTRTGRIPRTPFSTGYRGPMSTDHSSTYRPRRDHTSRRSLLTSPSRSTKGTGAVTGAGASQSKSLFTFTLNEKDFEKKYLLQYPKQNL